MYFLTTPNPRQYLSTSLCASLDQAIPFSDLIVPFPAPLCVRQLLVCLIVVTSVSEQLLEEKDSELYWMYYSVF